MSDSVQHRCVVFSSCSGGETKRLPVPIDPGSVPPHLRPHILPPIRSVFFDDPTPTEASAASSSSISAPSPCPVTQADDLRRAVAQMNAVEAHTASWRRRAEIHAAANQKLFAVARAAKDCALRMRQERDTERSRYILLKRKLSELMCVPCLSSALVYGCADSQARTQAGARPRIRVALHEAQVRRAKSCRTACRPARVPDTGQNARAVLRQRRGCGV